MVSKIISTVIFYSAVCLILFYGASLALDCYQCGEYTDGIGSITPCYNYTKEKHLKTCPSGKTHCVKYAMAASVVRGCATNCVEKDEDWQSRIYCCDEDACNNSLKLDNSHHHHNIIVIVIIIAIML